MGKELVIQFNELPLHLVWLCQESTIQPKFDHDIIQTVPLLPGNAAWKGIKDVVEICGRLYVEGGEHPDGLATTGRDIDPNFVGTRRMLIGKHPRYFSKGPTHLLGYTIENPTWAKLLPGLTWKPMETASEESVLVEV